MKTLRTLGDWLDERTGWRADAQAWLDHPVAGGRRWASALGASVATCFVVLALTGLLLMTAYAPSPQTAWASVHYIQFRQEHGWIVRGLHYWAAQSLFVLAGLHIAHGAFAAGYRKPREIVWWLTLVVLALALAEGITGGLLPWDQLGWWARVVEGNIVGLAPVIGGWISQMIAGGPELGALGLERAFTQHVIILPAVITVVLVARSRLAARYEASSPGPQVARSSALARGATVWVIVVALLFALTGARHGAPLEAPADPMSDYPARPEWFLFSLFQLRHFFHGSMEFWGTTILPGAAGGYLALLPWLDRPSRPRALVLAPVAAIFAVAVGLGAFAWVHDSRDAQYQKARAKVALKSAAAARLAMDGVPPEGALAMVRNDPELRGRDIFERACASCHLLGDLGDPKKATATKLDHWGTTEWIQAMIHDPDAPEFFGKGPYLGKMPSVDVRPKNKPPNEKFIPMTKDDGEKHAVAAFLASLGDEPGDPPTALAPALRAQAEKVVSERCTTCHLYKGDGDDEGSGTAPELAGYGSVDWTRAQVANPANPKTYRDAALDPAMKRHMPRFDKDLSPADVDLVARWTRAHGRGLTLR